MKQKKALLSQIDIEAFVNADHRNPHQYLGNHYKEVDGKNGTLITVFRPDVKSLTVITKVKRTVKYPMRKIHENGLFEIFIEKKDIKEYSLLAISFADDEFTFIDPYAFTPSLGDLDLHLTGCGNHYKLYEKLGCHKHIVNKVEGFAFSVWAPNAKRVSVVGDFNHWDGRIHTMRLLGDSGIWEIFIPGIVQDDKYKFEIKTLTDDVLLKIDPYAFCAELRPNTASKVHEFEDFEWADSAFMNKRSKQNPLEQPMNIYEFHVGSWKTIPEEGNRSLTYIELADKLIPYVLEMGYTHVELMPITEYPFDGSWGYQVLGYFATTSRYGKPEDFMEFVNRCHQNGIGVLIDWVPAHFPKDSHGLAKFDGTSLFEHADARQGDHPHWGTHIFNYGRNEISNFLISNALFWFDKYHIDGLRVDAVASMLYLDYGREGNDWIPNEDGGNINLDAIEFFKHLNSVVHQEYPGISMIAEESTAYPLISRPANEGGLGFDFKWNMGWMNDFLDYMEKEPVHRKHHHDSLTFAIYYAFTENFILPLSHDEVVHGKGSLINKMPGNNWEKFANLRALFATMLGFPGKKLNFMGGEFAQSKEWNHEMSLDWHFLDYPEHNGMKNLVRDLNHFYLKEPAMWENDFEYTGFEWVDFSDWENSIISFIRKNKNDSREVVFVCNLTPVPRGDYRIGVKRHTFYKEMINTDAAIYGGSDMGNAGGLHSDEVSVHGKGYSLNLNLPPLSVLIFQPEEDI